MAQFLSFQEQNISVGDTIRVHQKITEGSKTRTQVFEGIVIAIRNSGSGQSFVVRRIGAGSVGIEKIFPVRLPSIERIELKRKGDVRKAKLYYLRDRIGKAASKIKEKATNRASAPAA